VPAVLHSNSIHVSCRFARGQLLKGKEDLVEFKVLYLKVGILLSVSLNRLNKTKNRCSQCSRHGGRTVKSQASSDVDLCGEDVKCIHCKVFLGAGP
jgi:hypothetical protein